MRCVDAPTMQRIDRALSAQLGQTTLMQRAGHAIAEFIRARLSNGTIAAFAGPGNNGGDAFVACAELAAEFPCIVFANASKPDQTVRSYAEQRARDAGVTIMPLPDAHLSDAEQELVTTHLAQADFVLDGLLGIGGRNTTTGFAELISLINAAQTTVIALDMPTGIDATTGAVAEPAAIMADYTLMLGLAKLGAFYPSARKYCGELWCADLGIGSTGDLAGEDGVEKSERLPRISLTTATDVQALLPERAWESDKRLSGAPLIIAGSHEYPGAAILCGNGAARAGAGYVTIATPNDAVSTVRNHFVEQVVVGFDCDNVAGSIATLVKLCQRATSLAIGPGLPVTPQVGEIMRGLIAQTDLPMVIDASGIKHLHGQLDLVRDRACVITPHAGEFAHLTDQAPLKEHERMSGLQRFVEQTGISTLLKGSSTLIADRRQMYLNATGTNALATAGTGDVLTGIIATLLSQGLSPIDAARCAAYIHGIAGQDEQRARVRGVMAGDLPEALSEVWHSLRLHQQTLTLTADSAIRLDYL